MAGWEFYSIVYAAPATSYYVLRLTSSYAARLCPTSYVLSLYAYMPMSYIPMPYAICPLCPMALCHLCHLSCRSYAVCRMPYVIHRTSYFEYVCAYGLYRCASMHLCIYASMHLYLYASGAGAASSTAGASASASTASTASTGASASASASIGAATASTDTATATATGAGAGVGFLGPNV
jgi:hypothetical protein